MITTVIPPGPLQKGHIGAMRHQSLLLYYIAVLSMKLTLVRLTHCSLPTAVFVSHVPPDGGVPHSPHNHCWFLITQLKVAVPYMSNINDTLLIATQTSRLTSILKD